jgi:hypothetical protein
MITVVGCSDSGPSRTAIWGNVNWKGQPIPKGIVYFGPDTSKGNTGPQGFALISDGKYDTRAKNSKGCMQGPHKAIIHGCDGQDIGPGTPYGHNLFVPFEMAIDIPSAGGEFDLSVPDSVLPQPVTNYEKQ